MAGHTRTRLTGEKFKTSHSLYSVLDKGYFGVPVGEFPRGELEMCSVASREPSAR